MVRWAQICAGTSTHILQDTRPIPHMEGHWTEHLQEGMAYIKATIRHKYKGCIPKQRENDQHIMDIFLDSPEVPVDNLPLLNYVQYYTESTTLAEITTSDGKRIRPELFHPEQFIEKDTMWHRHDPITWPRYRNIDTATQRLWKASLIATVCNYDGVLHKPLGKWLARNKQWQHWNMKDALYMQYDHGWKKHQVISNSRTKITYTRKSEHVPSKPVGGSPITDVRLCEQHLESTPPMEVVGEEKKQRTPPTSFR
eukprot:11231603-Ditylum_brightwellii.AAC.1